MTKQINDDLKQRVYNGVKEIMNSWGYEYKDIVKFHINNKEINMSPIDQSCFDLYRFMCKPNSKYDSLITSNESQYILQHDAIALVKSALEQLKDYKIDPTKKCNTSC